MGAPGKSHRKGISVIELFEMFPDNDTAQQWFEQERWPRTLCCPRCGGVDKAKRTEHGVPMAFWCGDCRKHFSVRTGTILERSKIPLQKWVIGIFLHLSSLKGVSSLKLHRDLKITQKSAWHMLHRIRKAYESKKSLLDGPVEIDETFIGGVEANKHAHKKLRSGRGPVGKAVVAGIKDRNTKEVRTAVVSDTTADTLQGFVRGNVRRRAAKYTDENGSYDGLPFHETVKHGVGTG